MLLKPDATENKRLFKFLFFGLESKDIASRVISLEKLRKIKKKFTKKSEEFKIRTKVFDEILSKTPSKWTRARDYQLCKGILNHGFGNWGKIARDKRLWLKKEQLKSGKVQEELAAVLLPGEGANTRGPEAQAKVQGFIEAWLRFRGYSLLQCLLKTSVKATGEAKKPN